MNFGAKTIVLIIAFLGLGFVALLFLQGPYEGEDRERAEAFRDGVGDLIDAAQPPRYPDDGIRRIGSSEPDSDTSECDWQNLSVDQKIRTRFAGRILEFPCTARPRGRWFAAIAPSGEVVEERYSLTLSLQFNSLEGKDTVWPLPRNQVEGSPEGAQIALRSGLAQVSPQSDAKYILSATYIGAIEDLDLELYRGPRRLFAVVKSELESTGSYAYLSCLWDGEGDPYSFFRPTENEFQPVQCNGIWIWDGDIRVRWAPFYDRNLSRFSEWYYLIQQNFNEMKIGEYEPNYDLQEKRVRSCNVHSIAKQRSSKGRTQRTGKNFKPEDAKTPRRIKAFLI